MKSFIVLAICFAAALAAPASLSVDDLLLRDRQAGVLRNNVDNIGVGGYSFDYETENGLKGQAVATVEAVPVADGSVVEALVVRGSYSYIGKDGVVYTVTYVADKDGFHPSGAHLPTV